MQVTDNPPRRIMMQRYVAGTEPRARRDRTLLLHMVLKVQKELVPSIGMEGRAVDCWKEKSWFLSEQKERRRAVGGHSPLTKGVRSAR